jgi:cytidylate kinase
MRQRPVVAIDGPAGSGKSTTARAVAEALGFTHLDSGALYRTVTLVALEKLRGAPDGWTAEAIVTAAVSDGVKVTAEGGSFRVERGGRPVGEEIRAEAVTREVSRVAAMRPVRTLVNGLLRTAGARGGVVMDGRDIGTAVFPDAEVKVFLVAEPAERARRRLAERGLPTDERAVKAEAGALLARDQHDKGRDADPLLQAGDAVVIDTTHLAFDEQVRRVVELVRRPGLRLTGGRDDLAGGLR